ncbi:bactofilin family protein [Paenibacillus alvei]|uniref:bactofilin family protein n=1 Tax=Paenibacillus alvei TaxID=44250 RepID=UPI002282F542|nr:polymer-forming cytoskeletal protein [Paenibacillus alvei]
MLRRSTQQPKHSDTYIAPGTQLEGAIRCEANIRIDGKFTGEVTCSGTITIGEHGEAYSTLTANHIIVAGSVVGDIHASGKLVISSTGQVCGNCLSEVLLIQEGGLLNGTSLMERSSESSSSKKGSKGNRQEAANASSHKESEKQAG